MEPAGSHDTQRHQEKRRGERERNQRGEECRLSYIHSCCIVLLCFCWCLCVSGLHTHSHISGVSVLSRPPGGGSGREVGVLFGHGQLIPTFTIRPEEEEKQPASEYLDAACAPAPRARSTSAIHVAAEGDTTRRLGLEPKDETWCGGLIKSTDKNRPLGSVGRPALELRRGPTSARSRSRSPTGKNRLSQRGPKQLSSSLQFSPSSLSLRARAANLAVDAAAARDVSRGSYRSPHVKDLARTRQYVQALDDELREAAQLAAKAEQRVAQAAQDAAVNRSVRREREWNRDLHLLGAHVRGVDMERKWTATPGMERIDGLYDTARDFNQTSTSILQSSLRDQLYDPSVTPESSMLNRSTVLHSPKSSFGPSNVSYNPASERQVDSMPDKNVDLGFWASGVRRHEEAGGGKMLLKTRVWPREPIGANGMSTAGSSHVGRSIEDTHGVNTSTTSSRVRAQEAGLIPPELEESFGPNNSKSAAHFGVDTSMLYSSTPDQASSVRIDSISIGDSVTPTPAGYPTGNISTTLTQTPNSKSARKHTNTTAAGGGGSSSKKKVLRPRSANARTNTTQMNVSHSQPNLTGVHTNVLNTSSAAMLNNTVTHASYLSQQSHRAKFDQSTGKLHAHPRNYVDQLLEESGIRVKSGLGGLGEDDESVPIGSMSTGDLLQAPYHAAQGIEGNGAILDLAPALKLREKAPWKYGGSVRTRRTDRKMKNDEDRALEAAKKKRLPSSSSGGSSHRSASAHHRTAHSLSSPSSSTLSSSMLVGPTSLKPSLTLASGKSILGRTRVTTRVDLTAADERYLKKAAKKERARAYSESRKGPKEPKPHHTSIIEEAMAIEKVARRERELKAREREWRQQQIWLNDKKKGMDALAAKKASEVRKLPKRPMSGRSPRPTPAPDATSAGAGGKSKPWNSNLLVRPWQEGMARVTHDIDDDTEVRGKDAIGKKKHQVIVDRTRRPATATGIGSAPDEGSGEDEIDQNESEWASSSRHHLTGVDQLTNPLDDEEDGDLYGDDDGARVPTSRVHSNAELTRLASDQVELEHLARVRSGVDAMSASQSARDSAALRAQIIADSMAHAEEARKRAEEAHREVERKQQEEKIRLEQKQHEDAAHARRGVTIGQRSVNLSFTRSPRRSDSSAPMAGASALHIAESYDRRLQDLIAFLRRRHPFMSDAERQQRAQDKAREMVQQELKRMETSGNATNQQPHHHQQTDIFTDYDSTRRDPHVDDRKYTLESDRYQAELDAMRRQSAEANHRYERMQRQAIEANQLH